jgi:hypothetical protein
VFLRRPQKLLDDLKGAAKRSPQDLCPTSHNLEVPFVKRTELQLLTADGDTGEVSLLMEDGTTKDDLNLPTFVQIGEPTDDDKKARAGEEHLTI